MAASTSTVVELHPLDECIERLTLVGTARVASDLDLLELLDEVRACDREAKRYLSVVETKVYVVACAPRSPRTRFRSRQPQAMLADRTQGLRSAVRRRRALLEAIRDRERDASALCAQAG